MALLLRSSRMLCTNCFINVCRSVAGQQALRAVSTGASIHKELTPFQLKKITLEFDHIYDSNGDGFMDLDEISSFKRRVKRFVEKVQGRAMKDAYSLAYDDYWSILQELAETDREGRIPRSSWIQLWEDIIMKADGDIGVKSLPKWVRFMPASIFPVMDCKKDGVLDQAEYSEFWYHVGGYPELSQQRLDHIFESLTEDGKYLLDQGRVEYLYADFYLSDDPRSPGKYIGGPADYSEFAKR